MDRGIHVQISYWLLLILLIPVLTFADTSDFNQGVGAFRKGEYEKALACFKRSEKKGLDTPNLHYNLGVVYYKLKRYHKAEQQFQKLTEKSDWNHLALYNLGLIAEARKNRKAATNYYSKVLDTEKTTKIKQLATMRLRALKKDRTKETATGHGFLSTSVGYDDNVLRKSDSASANKKSDIFAELYAIGSRYSQNDSGDRFQIDAGIYTYLCAEESECNYGMLFAGINHHQWFYHDWIANLGLLVNADFLNDQFYTSSPTIKFGVVRNLINLKLKLILTNALSWIEAEESYEYLTGINNRTTIEMSHRMHIGRILFGYIVEYNNRRDLERQEEFFSYSTLRHKVYTGIDYHVTPDWTAKLRGKFFKSIYPDANIQFDNTGTIIRNKRDDSRLMVSVRNEYEILKNMRVFIDYSHVNNESNFAYYVYKSNQIMLGFQKSF